MGEKIRDIHPIKIGGVSLMIELNEGYTASQGHLIHIQNKQFRFLLSEDDFYHFSTIVMRAWSEFDYLKTSRRIHKNAPTFLLTSEPSENTTSQIVRLSHLLRSSGVEHRFLEIQDRKAILIIQNKSQSLCNKILLKNGCARRKHPFGIDYGYSFLYQMKPFLLYKYQNFFIEVYFQLPCASLTPKTWIPLDQKIQKELWETEKVYDGVPMCSLLCQYIYHLCWSVFFEKGFSTSAKKFLQSNVQVIRHPHMKECLSAVFFKYTDHLIEQLEIGSYDTIISNYYSFADY